MKTRTTIFVFAVVAVFSAVSLCDAAKPRPFANAHPVAARSSWKVLDGCHYVTNRSNDGDSFHVTAGGKQYLFRLYFVDAPETDMSFRDRIDEQAKYFGITSAQTIKVGKIAEEFTR